MAQANAPRGACKWTRNAPRGAPTTKFICGAMDNVEERLQSKIDGLDVALQKRRDIQDVVITSTLHTFNISPTAGGCGGLTQITVPAQRYAYTSLDTVHFVAYVRIGDLPTYDDADAIPAASIDSFYTCDVCSTSPRGCAIVNGCDISSNVVTVLCISCLRCMLGKCKEKEDVVEWAQRSWLCSREQFRDRAKIQCMNDSLPMTGVVQSYFSSHPEEIIMKLVESPKNVADVAEKRHAEDRDKCIMRKNLQDNKQRHELKKRLRGHIRLMKSKR